MRNVLRVLHKDSDIDVVEAANGARKGADLKTPWPSYGTYPNDQKTLNEINSEEFKGKMANYGHYCIDEIVEKEKPDVIVGIEDVWAFDIAKKPWCGKVPFVAWTTVDSLPILEQAKVLCGKADKFVVWASFAEEAMKKEGYDVETIHGAIDYTAFKPLNDKKKLREKNQIPEDAFVIGFVFKNQLRKSVPNILEGFKLFKERNPDANAKLLLHADWTVGHNTWDIESYVKEKGLDKFDILTTYICSRCNEYMVAPFQGSNLDCPLCGSKKTFNTKNSNVGVSEAQLNEIYNMMDVYCHPFTSGGQELPIQEAKATGLITLVTEYSCGTDCCYEEQGGLPLKWEEYREPYTNFIKATTLPSSIADNLERVFNMEPLEKAKLESASISHVNNNYSIDVICNRLKEIALEFGKCDWDYDFSEKKANPDYAPKYDIEDDVDFAIDLYHGLFDRKFKREEFDIKEAVKVIKDESREKLASVLIDHAKDKNAKIEAKATTFEDLLDKDDKGKRIAVIMPESAGDVLIINSLMENLKDLYPEYNIYVITKPEFFCMIDDNPAVHKLIPFQEGIDNLLFLEGRADHEGYFDIAFLPNVGTQKVLNYLHNGIDKNVFEIR